MKRLLLFALLFAAALGQSLTCSCICCPTVNVANCSASTGTSVGSILVPSCYNCTATLCASTYSSSCVNSFLTGDCSIPLISASAVLGAAGGATVGFALILFGLIFLYRYHNDRPVFQLERVGSVEISTHEIEDRGCCASTSVGRAVFATLLMLKSEFFLVLFAMGLAYWQAIKMAYLNTAFFGSFASTVEIIFIVFVVIFTAESAAAVGAVMLEFCPAGTARCFTHSAVWTTLIVFEVPSFILGCLFMVLFVMEIIASSVTWVLLLTLAVGVLFCSCCVTSTVCCCRIPKNRGSNYTVVELDVDAGATGTGGAYHAPK